MPVKQGAGLSDAERHPMAFAIAQQLRTDFPGNAQALEARATAMILSAQGTGDIPSLDDAVRARRMIRYGVW